MIKDNHQQTKNCTVSNILPNENRFKQHTTIDIVLVDFETSLSANWFKNYIQNYLY